MRDRDSDPVVIPRPIPEWLTWGVRLAVAALVGCIMALVVIQLTSCASLPPNTVDTGKQMILTSTKIAACVQGVLAEEQLELLRQRREQEAADAIEADRLRSEMHAPSSVSQEVDKIVRPDAGAQ